MGSRIHIIRKFVSTSVHAKRKQIDATRPPGRSDPLLFDSVRLLRCFALSLEKCINKIVAMKSPTSMYNQHTNTRTSTPQLTTIGTTIRTVFPIVLTYQFPRILGEESGTRPNY